MMAMSYVRMSFLALTALSAAGPLSAQVRVGPAAEAGSAASAAAAISSSLSAPTLPALSPSLTPAPLAAAPAASFAPAAMSGAVAPAAVAASAAAIEAAPVQARQAAATALPGGEVADATLEALSSDRIGSLSGESAKTLSGRLLGLEEERRPAADATLVPGRFSAASSDLDPSSKGGVDPARTPSVPAPRKPTYGLGRTLADQFHHVRLLAQNYYWYSVTHIVDMWPSYQKRWKDAKAAGAANVSKPRSFFAYMRVAAMSGRFYVLGAAPLEDAAVIAEFRRAFVTRFDAPGVVGPKELAAFDAFTERARTYNAEHRAPSNMRKHIRDALIKASTMEPAKLAGFFDSLLVDEAAREIAEFQRQGEQTRILEAFKKELRDTLAEEPADARGRVRAAIVLGSFATGSAGPKSDFDVELLTQGGRRARVPGFVKRLTDRWIATGHHARNPVTVHDFPSTPTRGIIDLVHTGDYILVSLEPGLTEELQRRPGEYVPVMVRHETLRGKVNRVLQYGVIVASTYAGEIKSRLGLTSAGH